ncbi:DNA processing protein [Mycoplasma sp. Pen4]|uniref:DNA-processing protein DprA n=1 Tax=Mycoplasma sp. Pen4 TaxID=640330 RepID=UPI001654B479|nr:DNA-processing protein DprA [Mycoplasma sp. Pen4]QNM93391.1 DNA processing protein [Mycoplasma sp. Pen4]
MHREIGRITNVDNFELASYYKNYIDTKVKFVTLLDTHYYQPLFVAQHPPYVIYYWGNYHLLNSQNKIYVINEVENEQTSSWITDNIDVLVQKAVLVTNDYPNSESKLVELFREKGGKIIHIAKTGIDMFEKNNLNAEKELILSIYPNKAHAKRVYFKQSNYLASLIADKFISFSMKENSKALNLINCFLDVGKEVNCFPGIDINDSNNMLIKNGAKLVTMISDFIPTQGA